MNRVLIIACDVGAVGVVRALKDADAKRIALSYEKTDCAITSRYFDEVVQIPHPALQEEEFIHFLMEKGSQWKGALLLECDDNSAVSVARHRDKLETYYRILTPRWEILRNFIEKYRAWKIALEAGVPHPKTLMPKSLEELRNELSEITYPCLIKPVRMHEFITVFGVKNFEVQNESELLQRFELCLKEKQDVMVQQIIQGTEFNLYKMHGYINSKGDLVNPFFWRKVRQNPPIYGVVRVGVSTDRNTIVEAQAKKLMKAAGYRGFFSAEFKMDAADNQLKLIEVNIRMPRANFLPTGCGVNFPRTIYRDLVEDVQENIQEYRKDVYWVELTSDILNALFRWRKERFSPAQYIRPYFSSHVFAVWSIRDPLPFFKQAIGIPLKSIIRRLKR